MDINDNRHIFNKLINLIYNRCLYNDDVRKNPIGRHKWELDDTAVFTAKYKELTYI
jgi:hypothetical protein